MPGGVSLREGGPVRFPVQNKCKDPFWNKSLYKYTSAGREANLSEILNKEVGDHIIKCIRDVDECTDHNLVFDKCSFDIIC